MKHAAIYDSILELLKLVDAEVSVSFYDLNTNQRFMCNEKELFNTASLMKVMVGLQLVRLFDAGKLDKNATIEIKNAFQSKFDDSLFELSETIDSEKDLYLKIGTQVSVMQLLELMITQSSNLATNNLFELIERQCSMADLLVELEMWDTKIVRGVEDQKAFDAGIVNLTTSSDLIKLFQYIYKQLSEGNQSVVILYEVLKRQTHNSIIPSGLPKNVCVAHKTGTLKSSLHDAGLVWSEDGKSYILVVLSKNLKDKALAVSVFAKVSEMFYSLASKSLYSS